MQWQSNPESRGFFEDAGLAAASLGATIDLFLASSSHCGVEYMDSLVEHSGGSLYLYPQLEDAAMPQVLSMDSYYIVRIEFPSLVICQGPEIFPSIKTGNSREKEARGAFLPRARETMFCS